MCSGICLHFLGMDLPKNYLTESCLGQRFNFPAIGICAYGSKDIHNNMTSEQIKQLQQYHNPVWKMEEY